MPRRKTGKERIRNIQRSAGTYHITIPIRLIRELGWKERQKVVVKKHGASRLIVSDWKPGKHLNR